MYRYSEKQIWSNKEKPFKFHGILHGVQFICICIYQTLAVVLTFVPLPLTGGRWSPLSEGFEDPLFSSFFISVVKSCTKGKWITNLHVHYSSSEGKQEFILDLFLFFFFYSLIYLLVWYFMQLNFSPYLY